MIPIIFIFFEGWLKYAAESLASAALVLSTFITQISSLFISFSTTTALAPSFTISSIASCVSKFLPLIHTNKQSLTTFFVLNTKSEKLSSSSPDIISISRPSVFSISFIFSPKSFRKALLYFRFHPHPQPRQQVP